MATAGYDRNNTMKNTMKQDIDISGIIHKESEFRDPQKGDMLLASPMLKEPYFKRSAVLIMDEGADGGHLGLTLNVGTPVTLQDIFPEWKAGKKVRVYSGGPVETDRLFMLHTLGDKFDGAMEIVPGIYVGANLEDVIKYIESTEYVEGQIRFFLGYSGWSKDQLAGEIEEGSWALNRNCDFQDALIGKGNDYWIREVKKMGEKYRSWCIIPQDPELN